MYHWGWSWIWGWDWSWEGNWNWAWGGFVVAAAIFVLAIGVLVEILFLLNLRGALQRVNAQNRAMSPNYVWLNLIPVFGLGWFIYTVVKIKDSLHAEYRARGWAPEGDQGYSVGLAAGVLAIVSFALGWGPLVGFLGSAVGIARLVCWILYWIKIAQIKGRLGPAAPGWGGPVPPPTYSAFPPPAASQPSADRHPVDQAQAANVSTGSPREGAVDQQASPEPGPRTKLCAVCGTAVASGDKFCRVCGLPLPQNF